MSNGFAYCSVVCLTVTWLDEASSKFPGELWRLLWSLFDACGALGASWDVKNGGFHVFNVSRSCVTTRCRITSLEFSSYLGVCHPLISAVVARLRSHVSMA